MDDKIPFLIIDEDVNTINTLKKVISKLFPKSPLFSAQDGLYALELLHKIARTSVVLCDINSPGINGWQVLEQIRQDDKLKSNHFILMSQGMDKETNLKSFQMGADDFLNKPFVLDLLVGKIHNGLKAADLQGNLIENEYFVEKLALELKLDAHKMKDVIIKFQNSRIPDGKKLLEKIVAKTLWIAAEYKDTTHEEAVNIEFAANIALCGKLYLSDAAISQPVMKNGFIKNQTMARVPEFTKELLGGIRGFEKVCDILYHIYENFDGSGIPDKIQAWQIPLGSRILRTVIDFEDMATVNSINVSKAVESLENEAKRIYDYRIVTLLDQYHAANNIAGSFGKEQPVERKELEAGMILTRHIVTNSEMKIMDAGTQLDEEMIEKILSITKDDPVIGSIYVRR